MPNWCANRVTVSGATEDVQAFKKAVKGHVVNNKKPFSFNSIIPMPEELATVQSPVRIMTEEEIEEYKKKHSNSEWMIGTLPITQEYSDELMDKYHSNNWYDWCTDNWTCKWDCTDVYLDADEPDYLQYRFDTPWGPPENIYNVLVAQHPNVHISWFYDEPGMEFAGYLNKDEQ